VRERDLTGGSPDEWWTYKYSNKYSSTDVLWHWDLNETSPHTSRTWNLWRGYATVNTAHQQGDNPATYTKRTYYRGMNGDQAAIGKRSVDLRDANGASVADDNQLAGRLRQEATIHNGVPIGYRIHDPAVVHTGTRFAPWGDLAAWRIDPYRTVDMTWIAAANAWRYAETRREYDIYGQVTKERNFGDLATTDDDTCTATSYAHNQAAYLVGYPSEVRTLTGAECTSGTVLTHTRSFYDGSATLGAAPTRGLLTRAQALASTGPEVWATTESSYDSHGRATSAKDARGQTSTTVYTPTTGGLVHRITATNPLGHTTVTNLDIVHGQPVSVVDPNGRTTTVAYDGVGRLAKVWRPGRPTTGAPDVEYQYMVRDNGPNVVTTKKLGPTGTQITTYELLDGRLRPRQTQVPAPAAHGGRVVTDTAYDNRGRVAKTSTFHTTGNPADLVEGRAEVGDDLRLRR
jgi:YD repeat-containing protein